jgi:hypothetical protein
MARSHLQHPICDDRDARHNLAAVGPAPSDEPNVPNIILGLDDG